MACADWEQAAEDERRAAELDQQDSLEESVPINDDKSCDSFESSPLRRVSKHARKLGELEAANILNEVAKPTGSCSSFASYCSASDEAANTDQVQQTTDSA